MKSVCVFCGSNRGSRPVFSDVAANFGTLLAKSGRKLVYGGGNVGLMGVIADAALSEGGTVIGVIPESLVAREVAHHGVTKLHVVKSMHERKALMAELSDGFIAMPGGIGTLEEFFEIWTWGQLGLHQKPYGLLNIHGFFDPLLSFLNEMLATEFIRQQHRDAVIVDEDPERLLNRMETQIPPAAPKWIGSSDI
jgi:uncharacterized protein (TIGR00730 family)